MKNYYFIIIIDIFLYVLIFFLKPTLLFIFYLLIIIDQILILLISNRFIILETEEKYFEEELVLNISEEKSKTLTAKETKKLVKGEYFQIYQIINKDMVGNKEKYSLIVYLNKTLQEDINIQREKIKYIICDHIDLFITTIILLILKYIFRKYSFIFDNNMIDTLFLLLVLGMIVESIYFYFNLVKKSDFENFVFLSKCYIKCFLPYKTLKYALDKSSYKMKKELNPFIKYIGDKDYDKFFKELYRLKNKKLQNFLSYFYAICIKNTDRKNDLIKDYQPVKKKDNTLIIMNYYQNFISLAILVITFIMIYFGE